MDEVQLVTVRYDRGYLLERRRSVREFSQLSWSGARKRPTTRCSQPLRLIESRRMFFASADTVMVSIPFLNEADVLPSSTSCSGRRRSERP